jgi:hypothetical protein
MAKRPWLLVASAALLTAIAGGVYMRGNEPAVSARAPVTVTAAPASDWERKVEGSEERIVLRRGRLSIEVRHEPGTPHLTVLVPDGQIEDIGTVFDVTVHDGKTSELTLSEGKLTFRRHGASAVSLVAPIAWHAEAAKSPLISGDSPSALPEPTPRAHAPARAKEREAHHAKRAAASTVSPQATPEIADEDLAYMRIVALLREQRREEARLAAQSYLQAFPQGLRRKEVSDIAH